MNARSKYQDYVNVACFAISTIALVLLVNFIGNIVDPVNSVEDNDYAITPLNPEIDRSQVYKYGKYADGSNDFID